MSAIHHPPYFYELAAEHALREGRHEFAVRALYSASAVSIGHNRSARYEAHAETITREHGVKLGHRGGYLTEAETKAEHGRQRAERNANIRVGSRVRSFDFEGRDLTGDRACYVEGEVTGTQMGHYVVLATRDVFAGRESTTAGKGSRVGTLVTPPINGRPRLLDDGVTNFVEAL